MLRACIRPQPVLGRVAATMATGAHRSRVAVVLSGSGVYDGTEITEAVSTLIHLSANHAEYTCFAPDKDQMHVINHTSGEEMKETRNVLVESARISRGQVEELGTLDSSKFDAIIFPGGFGAAKNLSTFATEATDMAVLPSVAAAIKAFHRAKKPIGLCCIAPVLAAKVLDGLELTVGSDKQDDPMWPHAGVADAIEAMGSKHVVCSPSDAHVDTSARVVTAAAYMCETTPNVVFDSVGDMVTEVLTLAGHDDGECSDEGEEAK